MSITKISLPKVFLTTYLVLVAIFLLTVVAAERDRLKTAERPKEEAKTASSFTRPAAKPAHFSKPADGFDYAKIEGLSYEGLLMPEHTYLNSLEFYRYRGRLMANAIVREIDPESRKIALEISGAVETCSVLPDCEFQLSDLRAGTLNSFLADLLAAIEAKDYVSVRFWGDPQEFPGQEKVIDRLILYRMGFDPVSS